MNECSVEKRRQSAWEPLLAVAVVALVVPVASVVAWAVGCLETSSCWLRTAE